MFAAMTKITRDAFQGKKFTGERDNTDKRRLAPKKRDRANTAKPPRTRAGATYPGGKFLRRARKTLSARVAAFDAVKDKANQTKPGALK